LRFSGFPPFTDFCLKFLVLISCVEKSMWLATCAVLIRGFINLLVWIWLLIVNTRTFNSVSKNFQPSSYISVLNVMCILWNFCGGIALIIMY
jgi:NADH:ubiquinone oxidoreductase subunit 2 (subunit N)